jgi:uncharacterized protein YbaP (TraB family)
MAPRAVHALLALVVAGWATISCAPARRLPAPPPAPPAAVAPPSRALLWRVTHGAATSHLFGTIHLPLDVDEVLGPPGRQAFASARTLYVEMDLSDARRSRSLGQEAVRAGLLPPGESLRSMLPPPLWAQLQQMIPNSPPATLDRLQPWLAALSTIQTIAARSNATPRGSPRPPMDVVLVQQARARGRQVIELDSMQQQLEAFTAMPRPEALAMLRELLSAPDVAGNELRGIVDAYGDVDAEARLTALVAEMSQRTPIFADYLLFRRNQRWSAVLDRPLRAGRLFVAVGAGHLVGPRGLPALLERRGFVVERVR